MSDSRRALLSVSDRTDLSDLAAALARHGYALLSTGGTAAFLKEKGFTVTQVSAETGFPEVFGGRVKTLHPKLFGGILQDRSEERHVREAEENGIEPIDLVCVNLYPFEATVAAGASFEAAIEKIDVGGPSLLRAAAKNHARVAVLCDPGDYPAAIAELDSGGGRLSAETRRRLAAKTFRRTAAYDAAIARWLSGETGESLPERLPLAFELARTLRYGENPHQKAAFYVDASARPAALARFASLQGKELSYNNLLDADAALFASRSVGAGALTIVKHRVATGISRGAAREAFERAWASDPVAGFGGVVALTGTLDAEAASAMAQRFLEVVVAHEVTPEAREILARKPNLRVLIVQPEASAEGPSHLELRGVDGGLLVQESDDGLQDAGSWKVVTRTSPSERQLAALRFGVAASRGVLSNAIVIADESATLGIGGGRTSRVDACRDAAAKAGERARGAVAASDAFFPFADGLEVLAAAGIAAVAQPGGSVRDAEVVAAADERGLAMVFTGRRHFRH